MSTGAPDRPADFALPPAAIAAIARGARLEAIRELRAATGLGLRDASRVIANHIASSPALKLQYERQHAANRRRLIRWALVIDAVIVAAVFWWFFGR